MGFTQKTDKLNLIYESMINEKFIDVDDIVSIIYSKSGSKGRGLRELIADMIFVKKNKKGPTYNAKEITSRLVKAGLTKNEVGEVRTIFTSAMYTALKRALKNNGLDEKEIRTINDNFGIYTITKGFWVEEVENKVLNQTATDAERIVILKLKSYLAKRK